VARTDILWALQNLPRSWLNILDVLLVALVFFLILQWVRGTRAATVLRGIGIVLILVWSLSTLLNLQAFSWLLSRTLTALAVALPVIFQEELRRWLDRVGRVLTLPQAEDKNPVAQQGMISEIADAARYLSRRRHGALIVLERDTGLQEYAESGVGLDAMVSRLSRPLSFRAALHGAAILRGDNFAGAYTLPISSRQLPDSQMGRGCHHHRHPEVSDAVSSSFRRAGRISVVVGGRLFVIDRASHDDRANTSTGGEPRASTPGSGILRAA
jgi:diadenylate cyclase